MEVLMQYWACCARKQGALAAFCLPFAPVAEPFIPPHSFLSPKILRFHHKHACHALIRPPPRAQQMFSQSVKGAPFQEENPRDFSCCGENLGGGTLRPK